MSAPDPMSPASAGAYADRLLADAARAADGARARLNGALDDLFRSSESRLNDRDHTTMTRMLTALVTGVEQDLRNHLVAAGLLAHSETLSAELADVSQIIAWPRLSHSRVMREPVLIGLLLRRCQEHYIAAALRAIYPLRGAPAQSQMDRFASHESPEIEDAAAALLLAEARRVDGFGEPLLNRADLPVELQHRMTWWVAAALRDHMAADETIDPAVVDRALVSAAAMLLEGYDAEDSLESRAYILASGLSRIDALDDAAMAAMFVEGHLAAWVAMLSVRAHIDSETVWPMLADANASRLTLLLRAIGMERSMALGLLVDLFVARGGATSEQDARLADAAAAFDALAVDDALAALKPWRPADHFRRAVTRLSLDEDEGQ